MNLPYPTASLVQEHVDRFDESERVVENALRKLFDLLPANTDPEDVLLKVVAINTLYGTRIWSPRPVAQRIAEAKIDGLLEVGDSDAVEKIRVVHLGDKSRNNYSFATKYCAWHKPTVYPIYDRFVDEMLWVYQKHHCFAKFHRQDLWKYAAFKQVISDYREHYELQTISFRDIDKFLWLVGQEYLTERAMHVAG